MNTRTIVLALLSVSALLCHAQTQETAQGPDPAAAGSTSAPAASPAASPSRVAPEKYIIGPSDTLTVTVWKEPTLTGSLLVRPDGMISMPLLGDVHAAGLTPLQLGDRITERLKRFVQDPNVTVVINQIHSKMVYMLGQIGRPGPLEMTSDMTLLQAIASAGGVSVYANTKKMYILRNESGKQTKIPVHYKDALKGDFTKNLMLKPGDTIVVP